MDDNGTEQVPYSLHRILNGHLVKLEYEQVDREGWRGYRSTSFHITDNEIYEKLLEMDIGDIKKRLGYTFPENDERSQDEILAMIDQKSSFNDLIKREYSQKDISYMNSRRWSLTKVAQNITIECLRRANDGTVYAIYKSSEGGIFIAFFYESGGQYVISQRWYMDKILLKSDFDQLELGETLADVLQIDPYGDLADFFTSAHSMEPSSIHLTMDGYYVVIDYEPAAFADRDIDDAIVINIESEDSFYFARLLQIDVDDIRAHFAE